MTFQAAWRSKRQWPWHQPTAVQASRADNKHAAQLLLVTKVGSFCCTSGDGRRTAQNLQLNTAAAVQMPSNPASARVAINYRILHFILSLMHAAAE